MNPPTPLTPSDLPNVLRVQRSAYPSALLEQASTFASKMSLFPQGALGCFNGDALSAYVFCHPWRLGDIVPLEADALEAPPRPTCMYIHDLAVLPDHRGRGLAAKLLAEALALAEARSLSACSLVAVQGSERFWERQGFVTRSKLEYGPGIEAAYMVRTVRFY